ncbi:MAG: NAD-binding protein, partial [Gammaproteobacteria bacterium]
MTSNYKITVVGAGYVGMSLATILAQNNHVTLFDIDKKRVSSVNAK